MSVCWDIQHEEPNDTKDRRSASHGLMWKAFGTCRVDGQIYMHSYGSAR